MNHNKLRLCIVKVSVLGYFPLYREYLYMSVMAHSIIAYEINTGTLKDSSLALLNIITFQHIYSIASIEEHVIRYTCLRCLFKRGIPQPVFPEIMSGNVC